MEQIKQWYAGLEDSEQRIVLIAAVFFSLVIVFFGIIKPLNDKVSGLQQTADIRRSTVAQWQLELPKIMASSGQASGDSSQALSSVVTSSTRRFNLRVSRVQEKGDNEIQVWFDNVAFNDFIRWVAALNQQYQVKVSSVNIRTRDRDGLSSIDIKIEKG